MSRVLVSYNSNPRYQYEYAQGLHRAHFPVPAIPLKVHWPIDGYVGMMRRWDFYDVRDPWWTTHPNRRMTFLT